MMREVFSSYILLIKTCFVFVLLTAFFVNLAPSLQKSTYAAEDVRVTKGEWSDTKALPFAPVHLSLLKTGNILMWQGWEQWTTPTRIWDPNTEAFTTSLPIPVDAGIFCAGHALLSDGRVLIVGGHQPNRDHTGIKDVFIFDPSNNSYDKRQDMVEQRWYPSTTTLPDGRVLILSGKVTKPVFNHSVEIFSPVTNEVSLVPGFETLDLEELPYPNPYVMENGKVFVFGSETGKMWVMDVDNKQWISKGNAGKQNASVVMYRTNKILVTGGGRNNKYSKKGAAIITIDGDNPTVTITNSMNKERFNHNLIVLPDGQVLAVGGTKVVDQVPPDKEATLATEVWNPDTGGWTLMASMKTPRPYHSSALLLPNGKVIIAGGGKSTTRKYPNYQLFSPPYLFKGQQPTISNASSTVGYNTGMTITTPDAANIAKVTLIRLGNNTHRFNFDQRYLELSFTKGANQLNVTSPANANYAPPGYYMLFIINSQDVPSAAKIVKIG